MYINKPVKVIFGLVQVCFKIVFLLLQKYIKSIKQCGLVC